MTELETPHRCADPWWVEVLEECRFGKLSPNNHAFLHGANTTVPGSTVRGKPTCGNSACAQLAGSECVASECSKCQEERARRKRVVDHPAQCDQGKCINAPMICANNDVRYEVNKRRAMSHAAHTGQRLLWIQARDKPNARVTAGTDDIGKQKLLWLTLHDHKTAELPGMLPLVQNMPVRLTEKIDDKRQLLRGSVGRLVGWAAHADDESDTFPDAGVLTALPLVLLVQFLHASWKLPGTQARGVYPIKAVSKTGHLVGSKPRPQLAISRRQFALVPCYALTAHASQGMTLDAAIVDLQVGNEMSPVASYVALSRVRHPEDLLIFRPFEASTFTQGAPHGPTTLIAWLQGKIDDIPANDAVTTFKCAACGRRRREEPTCTEKRQNVCAACQRSRRTCAACGIWTRWQQNKLAPQGHVLCPKCNASKVQCRGCAKWVSYAHIHTHGGGSKRKLYCVECAALRQTNDAQAQARRRCMGAFAKRVARKRRGSAENRPRLAKAKHGARIRCSMCGKRKTIGAFSKTQLRKKVAAARRCRRCNKQAAKRKKKKQYTCRSCGRLRPASAFSRKQSRRRASQRQCVACIMLATNMGSGAGREEARAVETTHGGRCRKCEQELPAEAFTAREWNKPATRRTCQKCAYVPRVKGMRTCRSCGLLMAVAAFATARSTICAACRAGAGT